MTEKISPNELEKIIPFLLKGEVVGFPTETVYGLAVVYDNLNSFEKLQQVKKRAFDKPITTMVSSIEKIESLAIINDKIKKIIKKYMPGSITIVLKAKEGLPYQVCLNHQTIGIRIPANKTALDILKKVDKPLLVTSANVSTQKALKNAEDVYELFKNKIGALIYEDSDDSLASTVVDLSDDEPKLLRQGPISFEEILKVWREEK